MGNPIKNDPKEELVAYNLRVNAGLRERFNETCKQMDTSGSREIRKFMRDYIAKYGQQKLI